MATQAISCPVCNGKVAEDAARCPNCGKLWPGYSEGYWERHPELHLRWRIFKWFWIILIGMVVLLFLISLTGPQPP